MTGRSGRTARTRRRGVAALLLTALGRTAGESAGENAACWAPEHGYTFEACCPRGLEPVGNISCWWEGLEMLGAVTTGEFSYSTCCNRSGWSHTEAVLRDLMERATKLPYLITERVVIELDDAGLLPSRFVVNFGAADGTATGDDPAVPLIQRGYPGLAVEPDAGKVAKLRRSMPAAVRVVAEGVTPGNAARLLREAGAPEAPALVKVDIDSFDCAVLLATLRVSRPAVLQAEVNSEVPYPLIFGVHHTSSFRHSPRSGREHGWFSRGFFGCSAALAIELGRGFGYDVIGQAGAHDVLLMRRDLRLRLNEAMPWALLRAYTAAGVARAISIRSMKNYFGTGVGVSWLMLAETQPRRLLELVGHGIRASCLASQGPGPDGECAVPYTLSLSAEDFRRLY